ncbi:MAG: MFS transporter, partial [Acidobacteriota bacterium]
PAFLARVLAYDPKQAVVAQTLGVVAHALGILAVGRLADRYQPRRLMRAGAIALVVLAYPFYMALAAKTIPLTVLLVTAGLVASLVNGTFAALLTDMFPTRIRFSGVALAFNIAFTLFSGTSPLVATSLISRMGSPLAPALVMIVSGLLTVAATFGLQSRGGHVLAARGSRG